MIMVMSVQCTDSALLCTWEKEPTGDYLALVQVECSRFSCSILSWYLPSHLITDVWLPQEFVVHVILENGDLVCAAWQKSFIVEVKVQNSPRMMKSMSDEPPA